MRNAIYATLDIVEDVSSLDVALTAVEPKCGWRDDRSTHFNFGGRGRGFWQRDGIRKAQGRTYEQCALRALGDHVCVNG